MQSETPTPRKHITDPNGGRKPCSTWGNPCDNSVAENLWCWGSQNCEKPNWCWGGEWRAVEPKGWVWKPQNLLGQVGQPPALGWDIWHFKNPWEKTQFLLEVVKGFHRPVYATAIVVEKSQLTSPYFMSLLGTANFSFLFSCFWHAFAHLKIVTRLSSPPDLPFILI